MLGERARKIEDFASAFQALPLANAKGARDFQVMINAKIEKEKPAMSTPVIFYLQYLYDWGLLPLNLQAPFLPQR